MSGTDNLRPPRNKEEARARGRKGGVASGLARRKKRAMRDATKLLLDMPIPYENIAEQMRGMGFAEEDLTNQMAVIVSVWKEAMAGNVGAASWLRDTSGQNLIYQQQVDEFEYKKERDAGISLEMEDMDDIEESIYGTGKEKGKEEPVKESEDDTV